MFDNYHDNQYIAFQQALKLLNNRNQIVTTDPIYTKMIRENRKILYAEELDVKNLLFELFRPIGSAIKYAPLKRHQNKWKESVFLTSQDYFSSERIAIYTALFGKYDTVPEPVTVPDNCDFYILTDEPTISTTSIWKIYDIEKYKEELNDRDNAFKNRFFKMHPELIFPNYKYSIYLDANILALTDLTEFIYHIPKQGVAFHKHSSRNCIFEESKAVIINHRAPKGLVYEQMRYYRNNNMPENYGMLECPVIVREHHNPICLDIMDKWWEEFQRFSTRDQLSLPYVLYKMGIDTSELATLGDNILLNPTLIKKPHNK